MKGNKKEMKETSKRYVHRTSQSIHHRVFSLFLHFRSSLVSKRRESVSSIVQKSVAPSPHAALPDFYWQRPDQVEECRRLDSTGARVASIPINRQHFCTRDCLISLATEHRNPANFSFIFSFHFSSSFVCNSTTIVLFPIIII